MKAKIWVAIIAACGTVAAAWVLHRNSTRASDSSTASDESDTPPAKPPSEPPPTVKPNDPAKPPAKPGPEGQTNVGPGSSGTPAGGEPAPEKTPPPPAPVPPAPRNVDSEDNGSMLNANPIDLNVAVPGTVGGLVGDAADWFVLRVTEEQTVVVKVSNNMDASMGKNQNVHAEVYAGTLRLSDLTWIGTASDRSTPRTTLEPGVAYYVKVDAPNRGTRVKYTVECTRQ